MFGQSQPTPRNARMGPRLAATDKYRLFTLNNESRELQEYRVKTFKLDDIFECFFTSCYLGQAKPDEGIYLNALGIAGCSKHRRRVHRRSPAERRARHCAWSPRRAVHGAGAAARHS